MTAIPAIRAGESPKADAPQEWPVTQWSRRLRLGDDLGQDARQYHRFLIAAPPARFGRMIRLGGKRMEH
jgi:hypothetical protein